MIKQEKKLYGLIGYPLTHSKSPEYFSQKFKEMGLQGYSYRLFPMDHIMQFPELLMRQSGLRGLNVTVPYKSDIMNFLDQVDHEAQECGAVNTIKIRQTKGDLIVKGYNTDIYGFRTSLLNFLGEARPEALVIGNGGAAKAVKFVLRALNIPYIVVCRHPEASDEIAFEALTAEEAGSKKLWVQCTPLGMLPHADTKPELPYDVVGAEHLLFDLVYQPDTTAFMLEGAQRGAQVKNGLEMLYLQAEKSFEIWEHPEYR